MSATSRTNSAGQNVRRRQRPSWAGPSRGRTGRTAGSIGNTTEGARAAMAVVDMWNLRSDACEPDGLRHQIRYGGPIRQSPGIRMLEIGLVVAIPPREIP